MRKYIIAAIVAAASSAALAGGVAMFTGQRERVELVGGGHGYSCEYNYVGQRFWRTFRGFCPGSVTVD